MRRRIFTLLMWLGSSSLFAGTLTISSQGTAADPNESNDHSNGNVSLLATGYDSSWGILSGAVWISYKNTVCPGCVDPNPSATFYDPTAQDPFVIFTQLFTIPAGMVPVGGLLNILADDSVIVNLNTPSSSPKPGYAAYQGNFTESSSAPFNFQLQNGNGIGGGVLYSGALHLALVPGQNTLKFQVTNLGAFNIGSNGNGTGGVSSFGLAYILTLTLMPAEQAFTPEFIASVPPAFLTDSAPEPGSLALMGFGVLLVGMRYRWNSGQIR